jgi:hypothetical protein
MKTFKEKLQAVLTALGFSVGAKVAKEDMEKVVAKYNETHSSDFYADLKADQEQAEKAAAHDAAMAIIAALVTAEEKAGGEITDKTEAPEKEGKTVDLAQAIKDLATKNASLETSNKDLSDKVEKLSLTLENDNPKRGTMKVEGFALAHTEKHAFGIDHAMFSADKRWNKIAINPRYADLTAPSDDEAKAFHAEVVGFGKSLASRYAFLKANNLLDPKKLMETSVAFGTDGVDNALGNQYITRRQDAFIAQILSTKNVYDFFPRRYNVQDMEVIFNALFGEVTQAWQEGRVFKGDVDLQPEMGHVDDVSVKLKFDPMKKLERKYIGYYNTEGSDPVKWGMIEWYLLGAFKKAIAEQNKRKVLGCAVAPEVGIAGPSINSSTGVIWTMIRYFNQNKMLLLGDSALASYDKTTMLATVEAFLDAFLAKKGEQEKDEFTLVLNYEHQPWWIKNVRNSYGEQTDFAGVKLGTVPDYNIPIYWCPGMENLPFMILTKPGNVQSLEDVPGEMLSTYLQLDFETVLARFQWKEGTSAAFVGPKYANKAALVAADYFMQQIFMNKPAVALADNATTANGAAHFWFVSVANTGVGVGAADSPLITDITGAKKGQVYIIETGSATKPNAIAKAGKFADIDAWTPTAVGDYIMVTINNAGTKFRELERCVGGVRTVNKLIQPTLPESR